MNKKSILFFLFALLGFTALGQVRYVNVVLHFYGPLSSNRTAFEDSVMTFYDVYKLSKEGLLPNIGVVREDYSSKAYKQKFVKSKSGNLDFKEQVKEIKNSDNRSKSEANGILFLPYGIRQYERPASIEANYFFVAKTTDVSKNQFASCNEVKMAIQQLLEAKVMEEVHVYFVSAVDDNYKDRGYTERTFPFISADNTNKPFLNGADKMRLSVFAESLINAINAGKLEVDRYFVNGSVRMYDSLEVKSSDLDEYYFQNPSFSKLHFIYKKKTVEFVGFESNVLYFSFWTEEELLRPATGKYEFCLVKMKVGLNREGRIISMSEIESLGKTISDTNVNPKKHVSVSSSSKLPPPPPSQPGDSSSEIAAFVSEEPIYIGGLENLYRELYSSIEYPEVERERNISGTVYVAFVVEWDGSITNVVVEKGVANGPGLDKAAAAAVSKLGFFRPAQMNGKSVRYRYRVPIKFSLQ